jgi:hypothetical protein
MATSDMERRLIQLEQTLSERIARLEEQVTELTRQVREAPPAPESAWWKRIAGVFKDDPEFEEAIRLGRAYRESLRREEAANETA